MHACTYNRGSTGDFITNAIQHTPLHPRHRRRSPLQLLGVNSYPSFEVRVEFHIWKSLSAAYFDYTSVQCNSSEKS